MSTPETLRQKAITEKSAALFELSLKGYALSRELSNLRPKPLEDLENRVLENEQAIRETREELKKLYLQGYDPKAVPLHGMFTVFSEHCRIETDGECGCAFGQCSRGLIF